MTIKEAILKVLDDFQGSMIYTEVLQKINENRLIDWSNAKTPSETISAQLGRFIRHNDTRIKRYKGKHGYEYYSSKNEDKINLSQPISTLDEITNGLKGVSSSPPFLEKHLHKLLSSFLNSKGIFSKTIYHEKSNSKDDYQKWIHPDLIGITFQNLKNKASNALMKFVNKEDSFNLISYELKKEIKTDFDLKKHYFQAVSNSSWANYGYLVAFEINKNLLPELERLYQSFGIGIIELKANPYESEILFNSRYRKLDYRTIDKLCELNSDFEAFISQSEAVLIAPEKYYNTLQNEFKRNCNPYFEMDSEIEKYCKEHNIPYDEEK